MHLTRRYFLQSTGALTAYLGVTPLNVLAADDAVAPTVKKGKTLVVVFLRGGADGLNLVVPYGDPAYRSLRRSIGVAAPGGAGGGGDGRAIDLELTWDGETAASPFQVPPRRMVARWHSALIS